MVDPPPTDPDAGPGVAPAGQLMAGLAAEELAAEELAAEELAAEEWAAEELMAEELMADELMADELVAGLAVEVTALAAVRNRVLVGVDGPDAAGKTTLANRLAAALGTHNVGSVKDATGAPAVIRASVDRFHRPRAERYRRGEASPEGSRLGTWPDRWKRFDNEIGRAHV